MCMCTCMYMVSGRAMEHTLYMYVIKVHCIYNIQVYKLKA